jgi:hypothetical protein
MKCNANVVSMLEHIYETQKNQVALLVSVVTCIARNPFVSVHAVVIGMVSMVGFHRSFLKWNYNGLLSTLYM